MCCKTLVGLMNTLLRRASTAQPRAVTDMLVQQVSESPEFCEPFSKVLNLMCCKMLVGLMNTPHVD